MATSRHSSYGPDLLSDEEIQQLHDFFSEPTTAYSPNNTSLTQQPPCEYIAGVPLDWSGHGTSHFDYNKSDVLPLTQGKFLGHDMHGGVYQTNCNGVKLAWKRKYCRCKIGEREKREIEVIKKLSHRHIIRLVGTYTHGPFLGLLLWPVATCDLASLLEDGDWLQKRAHLKKRLILELPEDSMEQTEEREARLRALGISTRISSNSAVAFLKRTIGCIASAVAYLHESDIKHKDLKPSNILLSRDGLWVTDFGSATDFSVLTSSVTDDGERGTPKYFAPEVARFEPSGRAADIFSMGCIFLEIMILCSGHTLELSTALRHMDDKSFQSNLDNVKVWLVTEDWSNPEDTASIDNYLLGLVGSMMDREADMRPTAGMIERKIAMISGLCSAYGPNYALSRGSGVYRNCCYQEMFCSKSEQIKPTPDSGFTVEITFGRKHSPSPSQNTWLFYIEHAEEVPIESVNMFGKSALRAYHNYDPPSCGIYITHDHGVSAYLTLRPGFMWTSPGAQSTPKTNDKRMMPLLWSTALGPGDYKSTPFFGVQRAS